MKKTLLAIALAAVCAAGYAQDTNSVSWWQELWSGIKSSDVAHASNYSGIVYGTVAPKLDSGKRNAIGGGALLLYNLNRYVGAGLGIDYIEQRFSLLSLDVLFRLPFKPLAWTGWTWAQEFYMVPLGIVGAGKPLTGSNTDAALIADAGAAFQFGNLWHGKFVAGATWGKWINAGDYSGNRYHAFLGWSKPF